MVSMRRSGPGAAPGESARTETRKPGLTCRARVTSSVVVVSELSRSVRFYRDVFSCEVTVETDDAALLLTRDGFQVYLLAGGLHPPHPSGGVGLHCLIWAVDTLAQVTVLERALQKEGRRCYRHTSGGVTFLATTDPDGIRILVAHPAPEHLPRSLIDHWLYA